MRFDPDDDEEPAGQPDLEDMLDEIDRVSSLLIQAGKAYDDDTWKQFDKDYQRTVRRLKRQLDTLGIKSPFGVWPSLATWKAAAKEHGSYDARAAYARERIEPVKQQLQRRIEDHATGDISTQLHALDDAAVASAMSVAAVRAHLLRVERSLDTDPSKVISSAKNLVESTAKIILAAHNEPVLGKPKLHSLAKVAMRSLGIDPATEQLPAVRDMVTKLAAIAAHLGELRNAAGDAHGGLEPTTDVEPRHARLAARAAVAWCAYMLETLEERSSTQ